MELCDCTRDVPNSPIRPIHLFFRCCVCSKTYVDFKLDSSDPLNVLQLSIVNPDPFTAPWSRSPRLQSIELVYRLVGSRDWTVAINEDSSAVTFPFDVQNACHLNFLFLSSF